MWRIRATWRWDGGKPCAARPSSTSSASANGSSNPAFRTHVRNAEDGPRACRHAGCCEGSSNAKSCGTTRRPADTVFLHVYARSLDVIPVSDPLSDPPESHGRMAHAATCDTCDMDPCSVADSLQISTSPTTSEEDGSTDSNRGAQATTNPYRYAKMCDLTAMSVSRQTLHISAEYTVSGCYRERHTVEP